ncbi:SIS domain-containing protein [Haliea sp. E1-2-M8]|uniref:D-sedoheptulose-7-phosphate isomerase n=1 Tax=Haliea sp. E1-2-M8 TaxID=3064706 RepID=UPI0027236172|nr:SIS domain-containing protein [Haliea sp. E1-2-M8]MDO8861383.1 SIS domain-containing protein [Haliea sp. E1-2-M8]
MDDDYQLIAENFQEVISTVAMAVDDLAVPIQQAAGRMTTTLLADGKIMACGNGADASLSQLLTGTLLGCFEQDRPALPAMALAGDSSSVTGIASQQGFNDIYARQVRALGQPGDTLVCISSGTVPGSVLRAAQAAHDRNMVVVALSNTADPALAELLRGDDVAINCSAERRPRVTELHTMVIHLLCELLDHNLFGNHNGSSS